MQNRTNEVRDSKKFQGGYLRYEVPPMAETAKLSKEKISLLEIFQEKWMVICQLGLVQPALSRRRAGEGRGGKVEGRENLILLRSFPTYKSITRGCHDSILYLGDIYRLK